MSESKAPPDTTFRDARPGAEAKRKELLARARLELAAQPLHVRRVFVNRVSIAAAGCTLALGGFVTAMAVAAPEIYFRLASFLPGTRPAVGASTLATTFVATLIVYFVARAAAESSFTKAMLAAANPSDDLFDDLDRLGQTPTQLAIRLAQRAHLPARLGFTIGVGAIAAPIAAATHAVMAKGGWANPGAIDLVMFPLGPTMLNAVLFSVVVSAVLVHLARPLQTAMVTGGIGLLIALPGIGMPIWGVMLVGIAAGLAVSGKAVARQQQVLGPPAS